MLLKYRQCSDVNMKLKNMVYFILNLLLLELQKDRITYGKEQLLSKLECNIKDEKFDILMIELMTD